LLVLLIAAFAAPAVLTYLRRERHTAKA